MPCNAKPQNKITRMVGPFFFPWPQRFLYSQISFTGVKVKNKIWVRHGFTEVAFRNKVSFMHSFTEVKFRNKVIGLGIVLLNKSKLGNTWSQPIRGQNRV